MISHAYLMCSKRNAHLNLKIQVRASTLRSYSIHWILRCLNRADKCETAWKIMCASSAKMLMVSRLMVGVLLFIKCVAVFPSISVFVQSPLSMNIQCVCTCIILAELLFLVINKMHYGLDECKKRNAYISLQIKYSIWLSLRFSFFCSSHFIDHLKKLLFLPEKIKNKIICCGT